MDNNKLKFSDRLKALLKTESRQDVDPYVFSEPEPFAAAVGKNFKLMQPKNARSAVLTPATALKGTKSSSKGKCIERRIKCEGSAIGGRIAAPLCIEKIRDELRGRDESDVDPFDNMRSHAMIYPGGRGRGLVGENSCDTDSRIVDVSRRRGSDSSERRSYNRDHTLLYYPRAGDEISDSESSGDELSVYQRHWFTDVTSGGTSLNRTARLSQLRSQLRRRLIQLHKGGQESEILLRERTRYLLEEAACKEAHKSSRRDETLNSRSSNGELSSESSGGPLLVGGPCGMDGCRQTSLPCTRHCSRHIMLNADQLLFEHCTAKFSDNTQCCVPVFDVAHELPLCPEHARKRDNYHRKAQESKPKKSRKKPVSPVVPRPKSKSRPKKRKRPPSIKLETKIAGFVNDDDIHHYPSQIISMNDNDAKTLNNLNVPPSSLPQSMPQSLPPHCSASNSTNFNLGLGLGSLGLGAGSGVGASLKVELGDHEVFASLDPAEHDFGNVLNNLPADAFNDIFIESRNGEYEPSREEEEELERALEAVDKDVRNLERMGQTHGLLEPALLAQLMSDIAS